MAVHKNNPPPPRVQLLFAYGAMGRADEFLLQPCARARPLSQSETALDGVVVLHRRNFSVMDIQY